MTVHELPPRGRYLAAEVGRLAGVSGTTIGQWARRGYIHSSQSAARPRVYSYQDIAEAMVVHLLLDRHLAHSAIKQTITLLRDTFANDWPLSHARLLVPVYPEGGPAGKTIVAFLGDRLVDTRTGDVVLPISDLQEIATDLRRGGWAARHMALAHIEVDPDRLSGRPAIAGTRVFAEDAARLALEPGGRDTLRLDYDLTDAQIDDAVAWWNAVRTYEVAA